MTKRGDSGQSNDIARLRGSRMVMASEAELGQRLAESKIKQLTGGDVIAARFLHKEFFEFRPTFKIWMAVNHKPEITGTDDGIWRRIRLIPFEVQIPPNERDATLKGEGGKLAGELSGILNWALLGFQKWQQDGLQIPDAVANATEIYRDESDQLRGFLDDF